MPEKSPQSESHWIGWDERSCCDCDQPETEDRALELDQFEGWANTDRICGPCREKLYDENPDVAVFDACYACHGTGRYDDVVPCGSCDGEGILDV